MKKQKKPKNRTLTESSLLEKLPNKEDLEVLDSDADITFNNTSEAPKDKGKGNES